MDSKTNRRNNLRRLKEEIGTWPEVAEPAGTDPKYLTQISSLKTQAEMGDDLARRLEVAHRKPYGWMDQDHQQSGGQAGGVPVVGTVRAGAERHYLEFEYPAGHGDGRVGYNSKDSSAYGVRVEGESMLPRIKPGEFVIAEPAKPYRPGDEVLVTTTSGLKMVKQFLYERDGTFTFDSVNSNHERITVPREEISAVHYIVAITKSDSREPD